MTAIDDKYAQLGGSSSFLGSPTTEEKVCPDGVGHYRHFQKGSIHWHPNTGAFETHGWIRSKWSSLGWEKGFLGYPLQDEKKTPNGKGNYQTFQSGSIHSHSGGAFETHGSIRSKWASLGWENGILGFPITDEKKTPDGTGRYNHFQYGSIHWHPNTGAHETHGWIRSKWSSLGWEKGFLGYPVTDEKQTPVGPLNLFPFYFPRGNYQQFENGFIHSHSYTGAHATHGPILSFWKNNAWEQGFLGFPMSDEQKTPAGALYQIFEGGVVYWKSGTNAIMAPHIDVPASVIIQKIDEEVKKLIKNTPLFYTGATEITNVYRWYSYGGKKYYRVMRLDFDMEAEVTGFNPDVDLDLYLTFEAEGGKVIVSLIREHHSVDSSWWEEFLSFGFQEIYDSLIDKKLGDTLGNAIGMSVSIPAGNNLLAAQLQNNGALRLYFGA